jgi:hypothetical protein
MEGWDILFVHKTLRPDTFTRHYYCFTAPLLHHIMVALLMRPAYPVAPLDLWIRLATTHSLLTNSHDLCLQEFQMQLAMAVSGHPTHSSHSGMCHWSGPRHSRKSFKTLMYALLSIFYLNESRPKCSWARVFQMVFR